MIVYENYDVIAFKSCIQISTVYVNSFFGGDCVGFYIPIICSNWYFVICICKPKIPFDDPF